MTYGLVGFLGFVLLVAALDRRYLRLHEMNKYGAGRGLKLGTELFVRGIALAILLAGLSASVYASLRYPMILVLSESIAFGDIYATSLIFFNLGYLFTSIFRNGMKGCSDTFFFLARLLERIWLAGLTNESRLQYERHCSWRWLLIQRRFRIWFSSKNLPSVHITRVLVLLIAGAVAALFSFLLIGDLIPNSKRQGLISLDHLIKAPQALTGILIILGIPIATVIWFFRDQNNLWQLENSRKDINLKDFQKLAEWAAGLHLPEDKIIRIKKSTQSNKVNLAGEAIDRTSSEEVSESTELASLPKVGVIRTYSRRDGAVALQVSAIYQLQAFLRGDFGTHFQRPAFQLLKSVWMALTQAHVESIARIEGATRKEFWANVKEWRNTILALTSEGIGSALTLALSEGNGRILRVHAEDLPHITLAGWQGTLPGRKAATNTIVFDELDLQGAQLQGINLSQAFLSKVNLSSSKLFGADLGFVHLQCADLRWAEAHFAIFSGARMQGACLDGASFFGSEMMLVDLRGASLDGTRLQSASLNGAKLEGARLINIGFNDSTDFTGASADSATVIAVAALKPGLHNSADRQYPEDFIVNVEETRRLQESLARKGLILN